MRGLATLLFFNAVGVLLQQAGLPLPGSVIGLVLFTACLFAGVVKLDAVEPAADFLLRHMLLFFAPVVVGVMVFFPLLRKEWPAVLAGVVGSMLVVLVVTAKVADRLVRPTADMPDRGGPAADPAPESK